MCPSFLHTPDPDKKELTFEEIRKIIDEISGYRQKPYVSVSGGEPFLRQDIFNILKYVESRGLKYKILTSATTIFPGAADQLKKIHPDIFEVSLDGPEHIHDKMRRAPGAFSRTLAALRFIKKNIKSKVLLMCIITSENAEYLNDTAMIAEELGVDLCFGHLSFITPERFARQKKIMKEEFGIELAGSRCADSNDLHRFDTSRLYEQITKIRLNKKRIHVYFTQELSAAQIRGHYSDSECCVLSDTCYYPWYGARINPYGGVSLCKEDYLSVGNIGEESLSRLYNNCNSNRFRDYLRKKLLPLCVRCSWCGSGDLMTSVFGQRRNLS